MRGGEDMNHLLSAVCISRASAKKGTRTRNARFDTNTSSIMRYGFLPEWSPKAIDELLESADIILFKAALKNPDHVIHPPLPPPKPPGYNLRKRSHIQSNLLRKNFVYRMLFKDIY